MTTVHVLTHPTFVFIVIGILVAHRQLFWSAEGFTSRTTATSTRKPQSSNNVPFHRLLSRQLLSSRINKDEDHNDKNTSKHADDVMDKFNVAWTQITSKPATSTNPNNQTPTTNKKPNTATTVKNFLTADKLNLPRPTKPAAAAANKSLNNQRVIVTTPQQQRNVMEQYNKARTTTTTTATDSTNNNGKNTSPVDRTIMEQQQQSLEQQLTAKQERRKRSIWQIVAQQQSILIGAFVGTWAIAPFTALHHLYLYPAYNSMSAFEYDTLCAVLQGGLYAAVYRYAVREDLDKIMVIRNTVLVAFVLVRSVVRVHVPMQCLAFPFLMCGEPLDILNWEMISELAINFAESVALFGAVTVTMDFLLERNWIFRFPG